MSNVVTQRLSFDQGKVKIETSIANQGQKMQICGKAAKFRFSSVDNTSSYQIGVLRSQTIDNELTTSQLRVSPSVLEEPRKFPANSEIGINTIHANFMNASHP